MVLIFLATVINYLDRLTVSVLAPVIRASLHLSNVEYAALGSAFLAAYTISQSLSGKLYDQFGVKRGFTGSVLVWSVAAMLHAVARGFGSLCVFRFLLGLGEAGNWPGAAKTAGEWLPVRERALGLAIFNSGAAIGSVVAPPLIVWIQSHFGWQATFLVTGGLGFFWLALWMLLYRPPSEHPWMTERERSMIVAGKSTQEQSATIPWVRLLRYRKAWAVVLGRALLDPIWWLYLLWLPEYLNKARGFSLAQIGMFAWIPYLAADIGSLSGGFASGFLIARGWSVNRARKTVMGVASLFTVAGIPAAHAADPIVALVIIGVVLFGFQAWVVNLQTMPSDMFPDHAVGAVAGLGGTGSGIATILFTLATGWTVDHFSYMPVLTVAGLLGPIGAAVTFVVCGKIERVALPSAADAVPGDTSR